MFKFQMYDVVTAIFYLARYKQEGCHTSRYCFFNLVSGINFQRVFWFRSDNVQN